MDWYDHKRYQNSLKPEKIRLTKAKSGLIECIILSLHHFRKKLGVGGIDENWRMIKDVEILLVDKIEGVDLWTTQIRGADKSE